MSVFNYNQTCYLLWQSLDFFRQTAAEYFEILYCDKRTVVCGTLAAMAYRMDKLNCNGNTGGDSNFRTFNTPIVVWLDCSTCGSPVPLHPKNPTTPCCTKKPRMAAVRSLSSWFANTSQTIYGQHINF